MSTSGRRDEEERRHRQRSVYYTHDEYHVDHVYHAYHAGSCTGSSYGEGRDGWCWGDGTVCTSQYVRIVRGGMCRTWLEDAAGVLSQTARGGCRDECSSWIDGAYACPERVIDNKNRDWIVIRRIWLSFASQPLTTIVSPVLSSRTKTIIIQSQYNNPHSTAQHHPDS